MIARSMCWARRSNVEALRLSGGRNDAAIDAECPLGWVGRHRAAERLTVLDEAEIVKLAPEAKHLKDTIKMVAYRAETTLVRCLARITRRRRTTGARSSSRCR